MLEVHMFTLVQCCCPEESEFLSSVLTSEVNTDLLQICMLACQLVVKTPVGSQHLSCWLPEGLTMSAVIVLEGVALTVQQNYVQANLSLHQFSHLSHSGWRNIQEYGYFCYYLVFHLCVSVSASLATSLSQRHEKIVLFHPFFSWGDEETGQACFGVC